MSACECRSNRKYLPSLDSNISFNPLHTVISSTIPLSSDDPGLARQTTICSLGANPLQIHEKMSCMGIEQDEAVIDLASVEGVGL